MHRSTARLLAIVAAVVFGGCGYKPAGSVLPGGTAGVGGRGGGGGTGGMGGAAGGGTGGTGGMKMPPVIILDGGNDLGGSSTPDANCGARSKTAMKVAPDILIVLDRSGSMNDDINNQMCRPDGGGPGGTQGCGAQSKWALMIPAITQVVTETDVDVNWGLKFFPDSSASTCNVSTTAAVPIAPGNGAAITAAIMAATGPTGGVVGFNGTPTRSAAAGATTYMSTLTDMSPKFILLATDGLPTCAGDGGAGGDDSPGAVSAIEAARTAGFPTFVVGIATGGTGTADTTLSSMATAGGLPRAATPAYYPVTNATELAAAIRTLIGAAGSCTFQIGPNPTDDGSTSLDRINVFGDQQEITRDPTHTNGYDYTDASKTSIQVHGPLCEQIMSGQIMSVTVTFRCLVT